MQRRSILRVSPIVVILVLASTVAGLAVALPAHFVPTAPATPKVAHLSMAKSTSSATTNPKVVAPGAAAEARLQAALKASHVDLRKVYPPNLLYAPKFSHGMITGPLYPQAPEPVGVADYGVVNTTGTPASFTIDTTGYKASVTVNSVSPYYLADGTAGGFTSQLNVVLKNVTLHGKSGYTFWNQNVFFYDAIGHAMFIENNIWNFSAPVGPQPVNTFYYVPGQYTNGTDYPSIGYYAAGTADIVVYTPFTVQFYINTTTHTIATTHFTEVDFGYNLLNGVGTKISGYTYDRVLFNNSGGSGAIPQSKYHVDGTNITPTGFIPYDAEVMLGGPGGGSTATFLGINGTMTLGHLNAAGTKYLPERSTWSSGSETGETAVGVAEYYDALGVVHMGAGPEFIQPMWNSSPTVTPGAAKLTGTVTPSNAFAFVSPGSSYVLATSAWGPLPKTGAYTWNLEAGTYTAKFMLSNFDPVTTAPLVLTTLVPKVVSPALVADSFTGIYTPLFAWTPSQLANISSGGAGTLAKPYLISNDETKPLASEFATYNDYGFQSFPGISLGDTSAYVQIVNPAPFQVNYWGPYLKAAIYPFNTPTTNSLGIWLFNTSHVSVVGGSESGWFGSFQNGFPYANIVLWNSTSDLITGVTFNTVSDAIFDYGGSGNTIAGNGFVNSYPAGSFLSPQIYYLGSFYITGVPTALSQNEGGDLIFNNYFGTAWTAYESPVNVYDGVWPTVPHVYANNWNLSAPVPATSTMKVNNVTLTGSVTGSATVCGNYWDNYVPGTTPLPYKNPNGGVNWIYAGGDACPVGMPVPPAPGTAVFVETGLPSGTHWSVTVNGGTISSSTGEASTSPAAGSYPYTVGAVAGFSASPASGNVVVSSGGTTTVDIAFTGTSGWISGTATPASASVWVDGALVTTTSGAFNVSEPAGLHSIKATASGYVAYFNNVTVGGGATTKVSISLGATGTTVVQKPTNGLSNTDLYAIVGAIIVLAIAIIIAAAMIRNRRGNTGGSVGGTPPPSPPPGAGS